jgi:hypothetical protein
VSCGSFMRYSAPVPVGHNSGCYSRHPEKVMQKYEIRVVGENLVMTLCRDTSGGKVQKTGNLSRDRRITYGWAVACERRPVGSKRE